ncbi:7116_t:CDS:2 [Acaulospora morrowiae]|uniref:7116_t:CDS:1 n=1 Tax=Acaulospora morrowiae TaxID=94023 RepID=A0A9N8ZRG0_9GLOM|nr:7116_t:CDS:2 [Acaulospora morrowiae]
MNEEIKKKFCHLLMFDVPEPGQQDAITTGVKANGNNEIDGDTIYISKDEISRSCVYHPYDDIFKNIVAESFGQGTNDQQIIEPTDLILPNTTSSSGLISASILGVPTDKQPGVVAQNKSLTNAEVSKVISKMWWKETEEERFKWEKFADRMKLKHMQDHPDYVYQPKKPGTKKTRKSSKGRGSPISQTSSTTTFSAISNSNRNPPLADEAMITAIAESAFAESRTSTSSFFLANSSPPSPTSLPSPLQSEDGLPSSERSPSPLLNQNIAQSTDNLRVQQNLHATHILYTHLPPTPTEMVHYEISPQYLVPSSDSIMNIDPMSFFSATPDYMSPHSLNNHHGMDTYLDPQPVDKFNYYMNHEHQSPASSYATIQTFNSDQVVESYSNHNGGGNNGSAGGNGLLDELFSSNTVTASTTPGSDDMDTYFEPHQFQSVPFSRRNSLCCSVSVV